jgi:phage gp46-like protein
MTDVYLRDRVNLAGTFMDWLQNADGLSEEQELATAVRVALGTDALAAIDDPLPDLDSEDRRGWWGDIDAEEIWSGWAPIGCKNWLLARAKITDPYSWEGATLVRAKAYTRTALQPFIDQNICSRIDVDAARTGRDTIKVSVSMYRGPKKLIELRFQSLWDEIGRDPPLVGSKDRYVTGTP